MVNACYRGWVAGTLEWTNHEKEMRILKVFTGQKPGIVTHIDIFYYLANKSNFRYVTWLAFHLHVISYYNSLGGGGESINKRLSSLKNSEWGQQTIGSWFFACLFKQFKFARLIYLFEYLVRIFRTCKLYLNIALTLLSII